MSQALVALGLAGKRARWIPPRGRSKNAHWLVSDGSDRVVLCRWGEGRTRDDVAYELDLLKQLEPRWPVPTAITPPIEMGGHVWCSLTYLPGRRPQPPSNDGMRREQRARGRLMARIHRDLACLAHFGQRQGWRRRDDVVGHDTGSRSLDRVLLQYELARPSEGRLLRKYADLARQRFQAAGAAALPTTVIHGDLTPWNLRYHRGVLSGILDFELAHRDLRIADLAMAWRGWHDDVVYGYQEEAVLEPRELSLLAPSWWAWVLDAAREALLSACPSPGPAWVADELRWVTRVIQRRSPMTDA